MYSWYIFYVPKPQEDKLLHKWKPGFNNTRIVLTFLTFVLVLYWNLAFSFSSW